MKENINILDKEVVTQIYKEQLQLNNKKENNSIKILQEI